MKAQGAVVSQSLQSEYIIDQPRPPSRRNQLHPVQGLPRSTVATDGEK